MPKFLPILLSVFMVSGCATTDWRTASRDSAGIAPQPAEHPEAIVHVYAARAINWRGNFAVHSWIATKEKDATSYTTYHVVGWRLRRNLPVVVIEKDIPDRMWFGAKPTLITALTGAEAEKAIPKIHKAAQEYPYANSYRAWPGPNSNTFVSYIIRRVPEIGVELPPHAIGRDWILHDGVYSLSESGTGAQVNLFGVLGVTAGLSDGIETNILGLNFGVDLLRPALKLPLIGRIGFPDKSL